MSGDWTRVLVVLVCAALLFGAADPAPVYCPVCGAANEAGSKFCASDGAPLPEFVPSRLPASFVRSADTFSDEEIQQTLDTVGASVVRISARTTTAYKFPVTWWNDRHREFFGVVLGGAMVGKLDTSDTDQRLFGSGFAIGEDGEIVTNAHVAAPDGMKTALTVETKDGRTLEATVIGVDPACDLALLKIAPGSLVPLQWGDSGAVRVGQQVWAIGNPQNIGLSFARGTMSGVSATRVGLHQVEAFIHSDALIASGNSGGPLVDVSGRVLGVNAAGINAVRGQGLTIPSRMTRVVIDKLRKGGYERGFVGLHVKPVDADAISRYNLTRREGAVVEYVLPGTPAQKAGFQSGDVLYGVNGRQTPSSYLLQEAVSSVGGGAPIKLTLDRQGKTMEIEVTTTKRPEDPRTDPLRDVQSYLRLYFEEDARAGIVKVKDPNRSRKAPGLYDGAIVKSVLPGQDWPEEPITLNYYKTRGKTIRVASLADLRTAFARSYIGGKVAMSFEVVYVTIANKEPIVSLAFDEVWPIFL